MASAYRAMPSRYLQQLRDSLRTRLEVGENASTAYPKAVSDSFYIPRRHVSAVEELIPIFVDRGVYSEVFPTLIHLESSSPCSFSNAAHVCLFPFSCACLFKRIVLQNPPQICIRLDFKHCMNEKGEYNNNKSTHKKEKIDIFLHFLRCYDSTRQTGGNHIMVFCVFRVLSTMGKTQFG